MPSPSDDEDQAGGPRGGRPQQRSVLRMDMNDLRGFQTLEKATLVGSVAPTSLFADVSAMGAACGSF